MATLKDYLISGKFTGDIFVNGFHMSLKDMLISAKLSGGTPPTPEPIIVPVTIETAGAQTRMWTQAIDARTRDLRVVIPFNTDSAYMPEGATIDTMKLGYVGELYEDAEMQTTVGSWYNGEMHDSWTSVGNEQLSMGEAFEVPKGYYVRIIVFKRSAAFDSNKQFQNYLRENFTSVTLV
jgi:hypothetical protein